MWTADRVGDPKYVRTGEYRKPMMGEFLEGHDDKIWLVDSHDEFHGARHILRLASAAAAQEGPREWPEYDV